MTVRVGTSGWAYADWRERYFAGVPQRRWFEKVVGDFGTVELNVSFYRLPAETVFAGWRQRAPADAVIAVKASRYLTHVRRLRDPVEPVTRLMGRARLLGPALGPVLVQLPPDFAVDLDGLEATLRAFPAGTRVAVEPRHPSWWTDDVRRVLERHDAALVWADRKEVLTPLWRTASWVYLRFHEGRADPWPRYRPQDITEWAGRVGDLVGSDPAFAYFNNDPGGAAIVDALAFIDAVRAAGVEVRTGAGLAAGAS